MKDFSSACFFQRMDMMIADFETVPEANLFLIETFETYYCLRLLKKIFFFKILLTRKIIHVLCRTVPLFSDATSVPQYLNLPNWPDVFPQAECTWNITASNQNNFVALRFLYFSLRNSNLLVIILYWFLTRFKKCFLLKKNIKNKEKNPNFLEKNCSWFLC